MQRMIIGNSEVDVVEEFNRAADMGWKIVPGTMGAASIERVNKHPFTTPLKTTTPAGTYFEVLIWCVMEKINE